MITILSWNIQNGQGVDGIVSLERIAKVVSSICSPDIICFQEVSRNCELKDGTQPDQVEHLSDLFKGYLLIYANITYFHLFINRLDLPIKKYA